MDFKLFIYLQNSKFLKHYRCDSPYKYLYLEYYCSVFAVLFVRFSDVIWPKSRQKSATLI